MSKSQEMKELVEEVLEYKATPGEKHNQRIVGVLAKLQAIADRQDRLLEYTRAYLHELEYNDYVSRDPIEIAEVKKLIAECEGK